MKRRAGLGFLQRRLLRWLADRDSNLSAVHRGGHRTRAFIVSADSECPGNVYRAVRTLVARKLLEKDGNLIRLTSAGRAVARAEREEVDGHPDGILEKHLD